MDAKPCAGRWPILILWSTNVGNTQLAKIDSHAMDKLQECHDTMTSLSKTCSFAITDARKEGLCKQGSTMHDMCKNLLNLRGELDEKVKSIAELLGTMEDQKVDDIKKLLNNNRGHCQVVQAKLSEVKSMLFSKKRPTQIKSEPQDE